MLAYTDGGLFPILALTTDGTIVGIVRGGAGHLGLAGRVEAIRSLDGGRTWTPPAVIADSEWDDRDYAFGVSPAGTLILAYHRTGCYDAGGNYRPELYLERPGEFAEVRVTRSHDSGLTWSPPAPLDCAPLRASNPFGKIVALGDGTLILPIYGQPQSEILGAQYRDPVPGTYCSYLLRSHDDGVTWGEPSLIAVGTNETGMLALPDGDLLAVLRSDAPTQRLSVARSTDGGHTWSEPQPLTDDRQHPADLVMLANGDLLLTYGNRNPPYRIEGRVSRDGGRTWLDLRLIFSGALYGYNVVAPRPTDLGYPSSVVWRSGTNGQGVTVYYYNPSMWQRGDWRSGQQGVFFEQRDYRATAVLWDEAELIAAIAAHTNPGAR
jgi:sialidase-1